MSQNIKIRYVYGFFVCASNLIPPIFFPHSLYECQSVGVGGNLFKNFIKNGFHLLLLLGPAANGGVIK